MELIKAPIRSLAALLSDGSLLAVELGIVGAAGAAPAVAGVDALIVGCLEGAGIFVAGSDGDRAFASAVATTDRSSGVPVIGGIAISVSCLTTAGCAILLFRNLASSSMMSFGVDANIAASRYWILAAGLVLLAKGPNLRNSGPTCTALLLIKIV